MTDSNRESNRDAMASHNLYGSVDTQGGHQVTRDDISNFMPSFRSALSRIDNLNAGGAYDDSAMDSYSTSTPRGGRGLGGYSGRGPAGYGGYSGFTPQGLLTLAMGLPRSPYMPGGYGDEEYSEESYYESDPNFVRLGFSRTTSSPSMFGQRSSRVGIQMMMSPTGFGMRATRSSRLSPGAGIFGMPMMQMLMQEHDRHCPYHGTDSQHHNHHHEAVDDDYSGPIITELSDDEEQSSEGKNMNSLPSSNEQTASSRSGVDKKQCVNKNAVFRRTASSRTSNTGLEADEKVEKVPVQSRIKNKQLMHGGKPDQSGNTLRRKHMQPDQFDNRHQYEEVDGPSGAKAYKEMSNTTKFLLKGDSRSKSDRSQQSAVDEEEYTLPIELIDNTNDRDYNNTKSEPDDIEPGRKIETWTNNQWAGEEVDPTNNGYQEDFGGIEEEHGEHLDNENEDTNAQTHTFEQVLGHSKIDNTFDKPDTSDIDSMNLSNHFECPNSSTEIEEITLNECSKDEPLLDDNSSEITDFDDLKSTQVFSIKGEDVQNVDENDSLDQSHMQEILQKTIIPVAKDRVETSDLKQFKEMNSMKTEGKELGCHNISITARLETTDRKQSDVPFTTMDVYAKQDNKIEVLNEFQEETTPMYQKHNLESHPPPETEDFSYLKQLTEEHPTHILKRIPLEDRKDSQNDQANIPSEPNSSQHEENIHSGTVISEEKELNNEEQSDTQPSKLDPSSSKEDYQTGNQPRVKISMDKNQSSLQDKSQTGVNVDTKHQTNQRTEVRKTFRSLSDPSVSGSETHVNRDKRSQSFYQMIKNQLPSYVDPKESGDIQNGANPKHGDRAAQRKINQLVKPRDDQLNQLHVNKKGLSKNDEYTELVKGLAAVVDGTSSHLQGHTSPTGTSKGNITNKNKSPRIKKTAELSTREATRSNIFKTSPTTKQHTTITGDMHSSTSDQFSPSMIHLGANNGSSFETVTHSPTITPEQTTNQPNTSLSGDHHHGDNHKGKHVGLCTGHCGEYDQYARKCTCCERIHICCEHCDQVIRTLCGDCSKCEKKILSFTNQAHWPYNANHTTTGNHHSHRNHSRHHQGIGQTTSPMHGITSDQGHPSQFQGHGQYPYNSYYQQALHQANNSVVSKTRNTSMASQGVPNSDGPRSKMPRDAPSENATGFQPRNANNNTTGSQPRTIKRSLEEQHLLDNSVFDHPEWKHLQDVQNWNIPPDDTPPKKPPRNKNLHMGKPPSATSKSMGVGSGMTSGKSHVTSPNFSSSSATSHQGYTKSTTGASSYGSDYDGSYYKRQSSSGDRLSNLSDVMLDRGMVVKDVYPDGNCFFAAVVDQLRVRGEFFYTAKSLRRAAVKYLRTHSKQADGTPLLEFVADQDLTTWEGYLSRLNRDGEWADHIIISAISNVLKRRVQIHSIRRQDQQVNTTIMEPDLIPRSRVDEGPIGDEEDPAHARNVANSDTGSNNETEADFALYEDLHLGHIPEAHYVSLRCVDWEERLYRALREQKDHPSRHLTSYGYRPDRPAMDADTDSIEDLEGQISSQHQLPNTHFNFLFQYIQNGHFFKTCRDDTHAHPNIPAAVNNLYTSWGVGDRFNNLESYLVTDTIESNRSYYESRTIPLIWYMVFPHDTKVSKQDLGPNTCVKHVVPNESNHNLGYARLRPVTPAHWGKHLRAEGDTYHLKHMHLHFDTNSVSYVPVHIALKCDWPEYSLECKERMIRFGNDNGINKHTLQEKVIDGVRVIPVCSGGQTCTDTDCVEWKYSFSVIEYVLCRNIITKDARFCFQIMDHFLRFVFCDKGVITKEQIKAVFFNTCDELDIGNMEPSFLEILFHFMRNLQTCLEDEKIPDFFIRSLNLLENTSTNDIAWHRERLSVISDQYLVYMFMFLDQKGLMDRFRLSKCFDSLLFDANTLVPTTEQCFTRLTVMEAREWVITSYFSKAKKLISGYGYQWSSSDDDSEGDGSSDEVQDETMDLHKRLMMGLPLQEQWLYAFYLECNTGLPFVDHVCKNRTCSKIQTYFGEGLIEILISDEYCKLTNRDVCLPKDIVNQEGIASFAVHFASVLRHQLNQYDAFSTGIHFFLCTHTDIILTKLKQEEQEDTHFEGLHKTLDSLFSLFVQLYNYYRHTRHEAFYNLMVFLERVCNFHPSVMRYNWLAKLWDEFSEHDLAATARRNVTHLEQAYNTRQTRL